MVGAAIWNAVGKDTGSRTLISQTVGSIPSDAVAFETEIAELDVVAVDIHIIKEQSGAPRSHCTTIAQGFLTITLYKGIRTCRTESCNKIVHTLFRIATLEQTLFAHTEEGATTVATDF